MAGSYIFNRPSTADFTPKAAQSIQRQQLGISGFTTATIATDTLVVTSTATIASLTVTSAARVQAVVATSSISGTSGTITNTWATRTLAATSAVSGQTVAATSALSGQSLAISSAGTVSGLLIGGGLGGMYAEGLVGGTDSQITLNSVPGSYTAGVAGGGLLIDLVLATGKVTFYAESVTTAGGGHAHLDVLNWDSTGKISVIQLAASSGISGGTVAATSAVSGQSVAATSSLSGSSGGVTNTWTAGAASVAGGLVLGYAAKTTTYPVTANDHTINCTSGTFTVTLETATIAGQIHIIKNSGTGIITIATTAAQTIDGFASGAITLAQYDSLTVQSNGANWIIL